MQALRPLHEDGLQVGIVDDLIVLYRVLPHTRHPWSRYSHSPPRLLPFLRARQDRLTLDSLGYAICCHDPSNEKPPEFTICVDNSFAWCSIPALPLGGYLGSANDGNVSGSEKQRIIVSRSEPHGTVKIADRFGELDPERNGSGSLVSEAFGIASAAEAGISSRCEAEATVSHGLTIVVSGGVTLCSNARGRMYCSPTVGDQAPPTIINQPPDTASLRDIASGKFALVCVTPERVVSPEFMRLLTDTDVHKVIIDEAVLGCLWPCYHREHEEFIRDMAARFPGAGPAVFRAIEQAEVSAIQVRRFVLSAMPLAISDVTRTYLHYSVARRSNMPLAQLVEWLHCRISWAGIVYCIDQMEVDETAELLQRLGFRAVPYHGSLSQKRRESAVAAFNSGHADIAVIPTGQGQWIDRSDMKFVLHTRMPFSMGAYLQDTRVADRGKAGAECIIIYRQEDVKTWSARLRGREGVFSSTRRQLERMEAYCLTTECRHVKIMRYRKPGYVPPGRFEFSCYSCDNCLAQPRACFGDHVVYT